MNKLWKKMCIMLAVLFVFCIGKTVTTQAATDLKQDSMDTASIHLSWTPESGETSYKVYTWLPVSHWEGTKRITEYKSVFYDTARTSYVLEDLAAGENYKVIIWSLDAEGDPVTSCEGIFKTAPGEIEELKPQLRWAALYREKAIIHGNIYKKSSMNYNLYIDFATQNSADGYEINIMSEKGKILKKLNVKQKDTSLFRYSYKSLKNNCYSVKVRAYNSFQGKKYFGPWTVQSYALRQPLSAAKSANGKLMVRWEKIKSATGYDIYVCDEKFGDYKLAASVSKKKTITTIKKYNKKKFKKGKTYYYYVQAKKKVGKNTYPSYLSRRYGIKM